MAYVSLIDTCLHTLKGLQTSHACYLQAEEMILMDSFARLQADQKHILMRMFLRKRLWFGEKDLTAYGNLNDKEFLTDFCEESTIMLERKDIQEL